MDNPKKTMPITLFLVLASVAFGCQEREAPFPQTGGAPSGPRTAESTAVPRAPAGEGVATPTAQGAPASEQKDAMKAFESQHAAAAKGSEYSGDVKVPKAEGKDAKTVAEIFAGKAALKDHDVTVRGRVVKSASGIMGRTWLHIRDGSGSADQKDNDLTVTTAGVASVGDVVVVKGTVHLDRDFGIGYTYAVIIEDASVNK